ncbi:GntR family transcriptional regulator [Bacillus sp. FJAT-45350]|uniref:GntR family transcriptional regulator n=1 Tax=Bacillus sp. FJAT-45350 TaxID=2011014 RepID=UPI000BB769AF|nr:GntR family transcriptional regulator [Bacillus sp. FJAT-45350]
MVKSKQMHAFEMIHSRITNGEYKPGERIVIEEIAKEIGASQTPVREALRQLESKGLIKYKMNSGAIVQPIDKESFIEILKGFAVLGGYATGISLENMKQEDINSLKEINAQIKKAYKEEKYEEFDLLNQQFHKAIYACCTNKVLQAEIDKIWERINSMRSGFSFSSARAKEAVDEHAFIIELIEMNAPIDKIEMFVRNHKLKTVDEFKGRDKVT